MTPAPSEKKAFIWLSSARSHAKASASGAASAHSRFIWLMRNEGNFAWLKPAFAETYRAEGRCVLRLLLWLGAGREVHRRFQPGGLPHRVAPVVSKAVYVRQTLPRVPTRVGLSAAKVDPSSRSITERPQPIQPPHQDHVDLAPAARLPARALGLLATAPEFTSRTRIAIGQSRRAAYYARF
jgi:hypothetical protein